MAKVTFCVLRVLSPLLANILLDDLDKELESQGQGWALLGRLDRLARYVRGSMNYFGISDYYRPIPEHDSEGTVLP